MSDGENDGDLYPPRDARHIMTTYRQYILACKRLWGSARSLIHYREIVQQYLDAKRRLRDG